MDRAFWQAIVDADYAVPDGHTATDLTPELLSYLGSPDPQLRDEFAYSILVQWIARGGHYSPDALRALAGQLLQNLGLTLGERDGDTVFLRSFSAVVLAAIVYADNRSPFLTANEIENLFKFTLDYLEAEQDLRGYVPDKGWAHSCAHTADLLTMLARSRYLDADDLERLLKAVADKITAPTGYLYIHDEDERLVRAVMAVLRRDLLAMPAWEAWLGRLSAMAEHRSPDRGIPEHAAYHNTKCFLRSLYLQLMSAQELPPMASDLRARVFEAVKAFSS